MQDEREQQLRTTLKQIAIGIGMFIGSLSVVGALGYAIYALLGGLGD